MEEIQWISYQCPSTPSQFYRKDTTIWPEFKIMTREQRAAVGLSAPPPVHGANKVINPNLKPETQAARSARLSGTSQIRQNETTARSGQTTPMLSSPGLDLAGNSRNSSHKDTSSIPVINQNQTQESRVPDPPNVPALINRPNLPTTQLGPMPLMDVPSQQIVRSEKRP